MKTHIITQEIGKELINRYKFILHLNNVEPLWTLGLLRKHKLIDFFHARKR